MYVKKLYEGLILELECSVQYPILRFHSWSILLREYARFSFLLFYSIQFPYIIEKVV